MRETIAISIDAELANKIDEERGLVGRSAFCEDMIKKGMEASK
jgi:metal-responsive CopG/Arc/MetJ family transcriptional regulator